MRCSICGIERAEDEFVRDKRLKSGRRAYCIYCQRKWDNERYYRSKQRRYEERKAQLQIPEIRVRRQEWLKQYYWKRRDKFLALAKVKYALKTGRLIRPNYCEGCGIECKPQGHHDDYSKPLEVKWLCQKCHDELKPRSHL